MAQKYNTPFPEWSCCGGGGGSASFFFISETPDGITVGQGSSHSANTVLIQAQNSIEMNAPSILIDGPFYIYDVNGDTPDVTPLLENRGGVLFWNDSPLDTYGGVYSAGNGLALNEHDLQFYVNNGDYISFDTNGRLTVTVDVDGGLVTYDNFNLAVQAFEREIATLNRSKQDALLYYTEVEQSKETKGSFTLSTGTNETDDSTIEVHDNHGTRELIIRNNNRVTIQGGSLLINGPMYLSDEQGGYDWMGPLSYSTTDDRLTFGSNLIAYKNDITNLQFITEQISPNHLFIGSGSDNLKVIVKNELYFTNTTIGPLKYENESLRFGNDNLLHVGGEGIKIESKSSGRDEIRIKPCNISKLKEIDGTMGYLYDITYDSYSYDDARDISSSFASGGACSTFRRGNYVARNFDWYFDNGVEFVVRSHNPGCREVIGVAANVGIKKQDLEQSYYDDLNKSNNFRTLPFMLVDGINDAGLVVSEHVVPHNASIYGENNEVVGSDPQIGNEFRIKALHLPRYILDHCSNVAGVKDYLSTKTIIQPNELIAAGYDLHYLVNDADGNHAVIEFVDNQIKFIDSTLGTVKNCLANFHVWSTEKTGPITLSSGKVLTPADGGGATTTNHIEALGQGLERYNFMIDWMSDSSKDALYTGSNNELEVMKVMSGIWYSGAYTGVDSPFNTEFVGGGLTVDSPAINFELIKITGKSIWDARTRQDTHTSQVPWQTTHCVVYNIPNRTLLIKVQEGARIDESAQSEEDGNIKLASFRSLKSIQEGYVVAGFHDDKKEDGDLTLTNGAIYRLATMDAATSSESNRNLSYITVGGLTTAEIHFKVGTGIGDGTINTITFPSTWRWINETNETVDNTRFTTGNTYAVVVRNDGVDTIANVAYEYTTVVPGPTA